MHAVRLICFVDSKSGDAPKWVSLRDWGTGENKIIFINENCMIVISHVRIHVSAVLSHY